MLARNLPQMGAQRASILEPLRASHCGRHRGQARAAPIVLKLPCDPCLPAHDALLEGPQPLASFHSATRASRQIVRCAHPPAPPASYARFFKIQPYDTDAPLVLDQSTLQISIAKEVQTFRFASTLCNRDTEKGRTENPGYPPPHHPFSSKTRIYQAFSNW
jgi:hypothetical protein